MQGTSFMVPRKAPSRAVTLMDLPPFHADIAALVGGLRNRERNEIVVQAKKPAYVEQYTNAEDRRAVMVQNRDQFLSRLPPQGLTYFHRTWTFEGTTVLTAGGERQNLFTLDPGQSLILTNVEQLWLQAGTNALDLDSMVNFTQYQETNGKVLFNLLLNNSAVFNAQEVLWDVNGGAGTLRQGGGFSEIGTNLLNMGDHPMAAYLIEGEVDAFWSLQATPAQVPDAIGVRLDGFLVPTRTLYEVIISVRR